jgi:tRNA A-37 threonylcarbamoyl transferase component Bud32
MDQDYQPFCMADPSFYDAMHSEDTAGESFATASRPLPEGWTLREQDDWLVVNPAVRQDTPMQGWKIHASATIDNADHVLDTVWEYCVARGILFKFLRSSSALLARVAKYAPRGFAGKLVTIYPENDEACEKILTELGAQLDGEPSPYILSDLRWGNSPLFVRYGAFSVRYTLDSAGTMVEAIADGDGNLVPDRRDPVFYVPPWVTLPAFLEPHLAARNAVTTTDLPYTVERVLHFSNGGGIYVGHDTRTGQEVVLKEARPHAGLDAQRHDAVRRVEREHEVLTALAGIPGIPKVHDLFWLGEHRFLVMEYVEGEVLAKSIVLRYPLVDPTATPADFAEFSAWVQKIYDQVDQTIAQVHERGIVYGDLHLFNVMVRPDDTVALVDFEVASRIEEGARPGLNNPGFAPPRSVHGFDIDNYALACLKFAMFLPMTNLLSLHRVKAREFTEIITENFPVSRSFLQPALDMIVPLDTPELPRPRFEPDPAAWPAMRDDLARAIRASATPDRDDRLFPGDPQQFGLGALGLSYGAAGVLYALDVTGVERDERHEQWLIKRATNPASGTRIGLYDGLHGAAFTLAHLGYRQEALDVVDILLREKWEAMGHDLLGGISGYGLNLLHLADTTGEPTLRTAAHRAAELIAEAQVPEENPVDNPISGSGQPWAGLFRGRSGPALFLIRMYDETGDTGYLDRAAEALRFDLRRCIVRPNGTLEVNEGWRSMPYLDGGSLGIGMVLDEYLRRRPDEQFADRAATIARTARSRMYILPGLLTGRAGVLLYLAERSADRVADPDVARQVRNLAWHALPYGDGLAFPGSGLMRLSMDLGTGTAGVLLALGAVLHDQPVHAPLLAPFRVPVSGRSEPPQTPAPAGVGQ